MRSARQKKGRKRQRERGRKGERERERGFQTSMAIRHQWPSRRYEIAIRGHCTRSFAREQQVIHHNQAHKENSNERWTIHRDWWSVFFTPPYKGPGFAGWSVNAERGLIDPPSVVRPWIALVLQRLRGGIVIPRKLRTEIAKSFGRVNLRRTQIPPPPLAYRYNLQCARIGASKRVQSG